MRRMIASAKLARFRIDPTSKGARAGSSVQRRARLVPHVAPQGSLAQISLKAALAVGLDAMGCRGGLFFRFPGSNSPSSLP